MSFFKRLIANVTGASKTRIPTELKLLGANSDLVEQARNASDEEQEEIFQQFTQGRYACMIDWRASAQDIFEEFTSLLTPTELSLLPKIGDISKDRATVIAILKDLLNASDRRLFETESLGDFSLLVLVPKEKASEFSTCVGPWLIETKIQT